MNTLIKTKPLTEFAVVNPRKPDLVDDTKVSFLGMAEVSEDGTTFPGTEKFWREVNKGYTSFQRDDILFAKITPCFENGKIAQAQIDHSHGGGSTEFHVIRAFENIADTRFLLHFLRLPWVRRLGEMRMTGSAGQRRVPERFLKGLELPDVSLEEQRRIAEILDLADGLRAKRREALAEVEELTQAVFLEMFCQDDEWPWEKVDNLAQNEKGAIRTGPFGSQLLHSEFVDEGIPVLGIDNAVENRFLPGKPRFITPLKYKKLERYTVFPGDVLITIMGTCGRCAIVPDDIGTAINTKHLCCITLDQSRCLPTYFKNCFLCHPATLRALGFQARGAVMPGLNMGIIKKLKVPVPPLKLQQQFAQRVEAIEKLKASHQRSLEEMNALFASLQSRAFKGEL